MARLSQVLRRAARSASVAAAVPVRRRERGDVEFLLVRTSQGDRWTFPKGRIEPGEAPAQAAAREAREEAGVTGAITAESLGVYRYAPSRNGFDDVAAFLLDVQHEGLGAEPGRDPTWLGRDVALRRLAQGRDAGFAEAIEPILRAAERAARQRARVK